MFISFYINFYSPYLSFNSCYMKFMQLLKPPFTYFPSLGLFLCEGCGFG